MKKSSVLLGLLATLLCIIAILLVADCDAKDLGPSIKIKNENDRLPVVEILRDGDDVSFEISEYAVLKMDSADHYFEVFKEGRYLATIYHGEDAKIVFGNYTLKVFQQSDHQLVATMALHTVNVPLGKDLLGILVFMAVALVVVGLVLLVLYIRRELSIRHYRREHPAVWKIIGED